MRKWLRINRNEESGDGGGAESGAAEGGVKINHQPAGGNAPEYTPPDLNLSEAIAPEFRDKPYFKNLDFSGLIKQHVELQSKLGERPGGIPDDNASDADKQTFYDNLKAKDPNNYTFPEPKSDNDKAFQEQMKQTFQNAGISTWQGKILAEQYQTAVDQMVKDHSANNDQQFEQVMDNAFGAEKQAKLEVAKQLMNDNVPQDLKPALQNLSNDALAIMAVTLNAVHDKYIKEDTVRSKDGMSGKTEQELLRQARDKMASKAYRDFREPDHESVKTEVEQLYKQVADIRKGKSKK